MQKISGIGDTLQGLATKIYLDDIQSRHVSFGAARKADGSC
jgi:hypothetical protein